MPQTTMSQTVSPVNASDPQFPNAPVGWHRADAIVEASKDRLPLDDDHWETIRTLQEFTACNEKPKVRDLQDALDEHFQARGGMRYLYSLFPKGPISQGCRLAGLPTPSDTQGDGISNLQ